MIPLKDNVPTGTFPMVTALLILANLLVFGWQLTHSSSEEFYPGVSQRDANTIAYGAIPYRVTHPGKECALGAVEATPGIASPDIVCEGTKAFDEANRLHQQNPAAIPAPQSIDEAPWIVTLFSSMFMHGGWLHIGFNLLFLWIFGNNIEQAMGRLKFLAFYLVAGLVALYAQALLDTGSVIPTIGASGAIAGVLGAYALLLPRAKVLSLVVIIFFFTIIEVPAFIMLGIWFALQFLPAVGQAATSELAGEGGVAYFAHVGGFLFGLAAVKLLARRSPGTMLPRSV